MDKNDNFLLNSWDVFKKVVVGRYLGNLAIDALHEETQLLRQDDERPLYEYTPELPSRLAQDKSQAELVAETNLAMLHENQDMLRDANDALAALKQMQETLNDIPTEEPAVVVRPPTVITRPMPAPPVVVARPVSLELKFFDYCPPTVDYLDRTILNPDSTRSKFGQMIGNRDAIEIVRPQLCVALRRANHCASDVAFFMDGDASSGKTHFSRIIGSILEIPYLEIVPGGHTTKNMNSVYESIKKTITDYRHPVKLPEGGLSLNEQDGKVLLPAMTIFVDEFHKMAMGVQGSFLTAIEPNDLYFTTESGLRVDCRNVLWIIATTESDQIFGPLKTRFTDVQLKPISKAEMWKVVKLNNQDWAEDLCQLVAKYGGPLPREVKRFAQMMRCRKEMYPTWTWEQVAAQQAKIMGIDPFGMTFDRLKILFALSKTPIAKENLPYVVGIKPGDLKEKVLPGLMRQADDIEPLVIVTRQGYSITDAGIAELNKRK